MKVILRLLHFVLYFCHYLSKHMSIKLHNLRQSLRYSLLLAFYFSDERILQNFTISQINQKEGGKVSNTHTAVVINGYGRTRWEMSKVAEIIAWLMITGTKQVTVYDQQGELGLESQDIAKIVKRRLDMTYRRQLGSCDIKEDKNNLTSVKFTLKPLEKS